MKIAALIVSIVAILASVMVAIEQGRMTKKINDINIRSDIFNSIFNDYLIKKIPQGRKYLKIDSKNLLTGVADFQKVLAEMKKDSLFFYYDDKSFYDKLSKAIEELEDYIVKNNHKEITISEQSSLIVTIDQLIERVYDTIATGKIKHRQTK